MRLILLGPPGVGKGTQAERLAGRIGAPKISTGDIFREAIAAKSPMGRKAKGYLDAGHLVPDEVVIGVVEERLGREDARGGFILDGFPRTLPQAEALDRFLSGEGHSLDAVIQFTAPEAEIVRRISGRWSCPNCQRVYHAAHHPPPRRTPEGRPVCACGTPLVQRKDDLPETVAERIRVYKEMTAPLVDYYRARGLLLPVDAVGTIDEVAEEVGKLLSLGKIHDHSQVERGDL
jgi:adenylate kinase